MKYLLTMKKIKLINMDIVMNKLYKLLKSIFQSFNFLIFSIIPILLISCNKTEVKEDPNVIYTCSMDPQVLERKPGKCPICKMELTKTIVNPNEDKQSIRLSDEQIMLGNIKTQKVETGAVSEGLNLRGNIVPDQRNVSVISSRNSGRIEKLYFKNAGEKIKVGDHLYDIYSEELQAGVKQYLLLKEKSAELDGAGINYKEMLGSAREKLLVSGLSESQVNKLKPGNTSDLIPFYSKVYGVVSEVKISEGDYVNEGTSILEVADYSSVWVEAEAYPQDLKVIRPGLKVNVIAQAFPNETVEGKISFESPELESQSRINLVRIEIPNKEGKYKPGMRVTVTALLGEHRSIQVPEEAILYQPQMNMVWVLNDKGSFVPRMVETGIISNGKVEIKSGLAEGEMLVISGAYLIDSEYRLRKGAGSMSGMDHGNRTHSQTMHTH
jgi:membrane fusion protein, copper/silver efflux system